MNVTICCDVMGEPNNGTIVATLNLFKYLISCGHNVKVVANRFEKSGIPEENQCLLPTLNLGSFANEIIDKNGVSLAKADHEVLLPAIKWADVVHIQVPLNIGRAAVKIAVEENKPLTASFHCQAENVSAHLGLQNNLLVSKLIYKDFYANVYKYCDCVHYPTVFIKKTFEKACKRRTNAFVISNGVNEIYKNKHTYQKHDKFVIASTGRLSREKAQDILIKAVAASKHKDNIVIKFAGEGPFLEKYQSLAKELNVNAEFNFYSREDLVEMLNQADLYVHCAFIEIEAISCIEAICCGLVPIIANAKRSATKFFAIDDRSLFTENNPNSLARKIDFWYANPKIKAQYVEKYKAMSKQFDLTECMISMEKMLKEAVRIH